MNEDNTITGRLTRIEDKLDEHLKVSSQNATSISWLKTLHLAAWGAILTLFGFKS